MAHSKLVDIPILIFVNKQDKKEAVDVEKIGRIMNVEALRAHGHKVHLQAGSALSGDGVKVSAQWLVRTTLDQSKQK